MWETVDISEEQFLYENVKSLGQTVAFLKSANKKILPFILVYILLGLKWIRLE